MKKLLWIFILISLPFFSEASRHVSGYISVKSLGGYTYQVTVIDYTISRSCDSLYVNIDTMRLNWGDGTSSLLIRSNGSGDSVCGCRTMNTYIGTHTFFGPGSYRMWFDAGPRDYINNMTNSVNQDMLIFHTIIISPEFPNGASSPVIANEPTCSYGCTTQCYHFNPDASLSGGDSIAYSLGNCLPGIGYYNPGATINPLTGELSWCNPTVDGLWSFAIIITSYDSATIGGHRIQIPIDTEEVELQVEIQSDCTLGTDKITNKEAPITLYPNPSSGIFTVAFSHSELVSASQTIEIYNVLGEQVYSGALKQVQGDYTFDLRAYPNGIYLYKILNDGGLLGEGKLVIQK